MTHSRRPFHYHDLLRLQHCSEPQLDPAGQTVAWVRRWAAAEQNSYHAQVMLTTLATGSSRALTDGLGAVAQPHWSPDGPWLTFLAAPPEELVVQRMIVAASGGAPRPVATCAEADVPPAWWPAEPSAQHMPTFAVSDCIDPRFTQGVLVTQQPLDSGACANVHGAALPEPNAAWGLRDDQILLAATHATQQHVSVALLADQLHPGDLYVVAPAQTPQRVTTLNGALLRELLLASSLRLAYQCKERNYTGWVLPPPGYSAGQRYPIVLDCRGLPAMFQVEWQSYATHGYVVLHGRGQHGPLNRQEARALLDAASATHSFLDTTRLAILGGPHVVHEHGQQRHVHALIADCRHALLNPDDLNVAAARAPTLVLATSANYAGQQLYTRLQQNGIRAELVQVPITGHPLLPAIRPWHQVALLERSVRWLNT
ncbi:MAG: hypothetical protein EI684_03725 [Candidatus Viridilinea halotolerans]|uniref:Peptidase S9 prolyl oligopeptidase catalytic domain-containing protein n=1 Tax=Candidatus Viridilinea halotolerans TaxID=2491704 RepID=A0A426U7B4_9CHLR|nr:MAG: hypothetical protein EI684_03725 [Candidatus Viridilinea halotolerans]